MLKLIDLSAVEAIVINGPDFAGRAFAIVSNERIDVGSGVLKEPIMPLPTLLLGLFGTQAIFYLNGVSSYDPSSGQVTTTERNAIAGMVYAESFTLKERAEMPEVIEGDIKVYVPGEVFGYQEVALVILQVRETAFAEGQSERLLPRSGYRGW